MPRASRATDPRPFFVIYTSTTSTAAGRGAHWQSASTERLTGRLRLRRNHSSLKLKLAASVTASGNLQGDSLDVRVSGSDSDSELTQLGPAGGPTRSHGSASGRPQPTGAIGSLGCTYNPRYRYSTVRVVYLRGYCLHPCVRPASGCVAVVPPSLRLQAGD